MGTCEIIQCELNAENVRYSSAISRYYIQFENALNQLIINNRHLGMQLFAQSGNYPNSVYLLRIENDCVVEFMRFDKQTL